MIKYFDDPSDLPYEEGSDESLMISAEDQCWDEATLRQLRDEHDIIFMTSGDAVHPIMVLNKDTHPLFVIGHEDDGTIYFDRQYGQFTHAFSPAWTRRLISDLEEALRFINYQQNDI